MPTKLWAGMLVLGALASGCLPGPMCEEQSALHPAWSRFDAPADAVLCGSDETVVEFELPGDQIRLFFAWQDRLELEGWRRAGLEQGRGPEDQHLTGTFERGGLVLRVYADYDRFRRVSELAFITWSERTAASDMAPHTVASR